MALYSELYSPLNVNIFKIKKRTVSVKKNENKRFTWNIIVTQKNDVMISSYM